jgi:hypothetical protein
MYLCSEIFYVSRKYTELHVLKVKNVAMITIFEVIHKETIIEGLSANYALN